jgi:hypothetical protein
MPGRRRPEPETAPATAVDRFDCYAHHPQLASQGWTRSPFGAGELAQLTFDEWYRLDGTFPYAQSKYAATGPVFYHQALEVRPRPEVSVEHHLLPRFRPAVVLVHHALLLATGERLPPPAFSIWYFAHPTEGTVSWTGPFLRETIVFRHEPTTVMDEAALAEAKDCHALLASAPAALGVPEVAAALATLERTARPEFRPLNAFMHAVIALAALIMSDVRRDLTRTFSRRLGVLLAVGHDTLAAAAAEFEAFYRARSRVVHGEDLDPVVSATGYQPLEFLAVGRACLCQAVVEIVRLLRDGTVGADLAAIRRHLDRAWADRDAFDRLRVEP